jgi:septum formation protein
MLTANHPIILASGSAIRQHMLKAVGVPFSVAPSGVDEEALKPTLASFSPTEKGMKLAEAKALAVSVKHPLAYVIGADQICVIDGDILDKPLTYPNAQAQLEKLSGRTHQQISSVVLAHGGHIIWRFADAAQLTLRSLSREEIARYIAADAPLQSCGSYKFESLGRNLFAAAEGDHDAVKGLPLTPLLAQLHALAVVQL